MSAADYLAKATEVIDRIKTEQEKSLEKGGRIAADSIRKGKLVHVFGSGHSVIPVLDIFPRYGSFVGFHPLMDPRLMWFNVIGPGGAPELLWIERSEGYVKNFLDSFTFDPEDSMIVYSHGGLNAAPVEAAMYARDRGMKVIAITSGANYKVAKATHSSGYKLGDVSDVMIDNCVPLEDALVTIEGWKAPVSAGSTLAVIAITQALVAETAKNLAAEGISVPTFVSPNVTDVPPDNNKLVFARYRESVKR